MKKPDGRTVFLLVLPLFVFAHLGHHLVQALLTPLMPFIRESFGFDYTRVGFLISALNIAYGFAQLPGGWLGDRVGYARLILVGISGVSLFGLLMGLAPGFLVMAVVLVFMGIAGGGYHPSASPLISSAVDPAHRGKALGIHQIGGTGSFFLAPFIAVGIARAFGWRGTFIALSVPMLLFGIFFFYMLKGWGYVREKGTAEKKTATGSGETAHSAGRLVPVIILSALIQIFIYTTISFVPLFVVDELGGSKEAAALLLSVAHLAGLWAGPAAGFFSDRIGKIPIILIAGLLAGPFIYLLTHTSVGWSITAVLLCLGMAQYMSMPASESYVIGHAPEKGRSTVLGVYYFVSRGGPGLLAPVLGYLMDRYGFATALTAAGGGMFVLAVVCTVLILLNPEKAEG